MPSIVTPAYVKEVIRTEKCDQEIMSHILAATSLVNSLRTMSALPDDLLVEIKRWLAAHFLALSDTEAFLNSNISSRKIGQVEVRYKDDIEDKGAPGKNSILRTRWGRQAAMFDTTGTLAKLGSRGVLLCAV